MQVILCMWSRRFMIMATLTSISNSTFLPAASTGAFINLTSIPQLITSPLIIHGIFRITTISAGTVIEGLYISSGITTNADTVNNITFERCQIESNIYTAGSMATAPNHYGWLFVNNIINGGYYGLSICNGYNMAFMNNFFTSANFSVNTSNQTSVVFANNIFTNGCLGCGQVFF